MSHQGGPEADAQPEYPRHWEADVVLRDGTTMAIRPILTTDGEALQRFHLRQSPESVYLRFFAPLREIPQRDLYRFTHVDYNQRVALVVTSKEEIVAVGRFDQLGAGEAEVAFNVSDWAQGKGLGSVLLEHLAAAGRELGVRRFRADVLPQNAKMLRVFKDAGYEVEQVFDDGIMSVSFTIRPTGKSMAVLAERERRAEASSMRAILAPERVLLLTTADKPAEFGEFLAAKLRGNEAVSIVGLPGYPATLDELDGAENADLALLAARASEVMALAPKLAERGVRGIVLYSGGFSVAPQEGKVAQRSLVRVLRHNGLRLVGPRSFGVRTTRASAGVDAVLWSKHMREGTIGLFCQSVAGALGLASAATERDLGVASFLSAGHRVDVSGNDTMQFWTSDEETTVHCLRLESIGNPRKFSRVARRLSLKGPVIATIAGSTGQLNPPGHAVRTTAEPRRALDELMRQAGVIAVESESALLDLAALMSEQPRVSGSRIAVLTNSGTQGSVLAELIGHRGLELARPPIALRAHAKVAAFSDAIDDLVATAQEWDAVIVGYVPLLHDEGDQIREEIVRLGRQSGKATMAIVFGKPGLFGTGAGRVPNFATAEDAVAALAAAREYERWHAKDRGERVDPPGVERKDAKALVQAALADVPRGSTKRLSAGECTRLLGHYGISVWPEERVHSIEEALAAAEALGWPVALKPADEVLRHRSDLGGVRLDLASPDELREAYTSAQSRVQSIVGRQSPFDVQPMAAPGAGCVIRAAEDELYGPILSLGLAGDAVELLGDVSYRVPPLTYSDVSEMVTSLKAAPRLFGSRGMPALDVAALEDVIARVSVLKEELAEVSRLVLNPLLVSQQGAALLGATVEVAHPRRGDIARRVLP